MATRLFRGDSPPVAQVTKITPATVDVGDRFTLTCNGKSVTYTALVATVADVVAGLMAALNASTIPEFAEMLPSAAADNSYLTLTAATAGVPFVITTSTTNTTAGQIIVVETTKGVAPVNEVHQIALVGTYSGGTFTLTYSFGTTSALNYNATAAQVQSALAALAGVGVGNVLVTGGPGPSTPWFVTWTGTLAGTNVAVGTVNGGSLTGNSSVVISTTTDGNGLSNEIQAYQVSVATSGTYTLALDGQTTSALAYNATPAQVQTALQALPNIGSGNVLVFGPGSGPGLTNKNIFFVVFQGSLAGVNVSQLVLNIGNLGYGSTGQCGITTLQQGGQTSSNDFQYIDLGGASAGTFTLTYNGVTSSPINCVTGASSTGNGGGTGLVWLDTRVAIGNITGLIQFQDIQVYTIPGAGGIATETSGSPCDGLLVQFYGAKANTAMSLLQINGGGLSGSSGSSVTRVSRAPTNVNEVQTITVFATGGTFTLSLNAQTTSAIAFGAAAATIQTRIQTDLAATITACTVTGAGTVASPYLVTVTTPANTNIAQMTANPASLTGGGGTITESTHFTAGVNEVQTATEAAGVTGGTFTLAFNGAVTGPQAWNISAATLQTNLRALSTINGANVNVSGSAGGPYTVTFVGTLAAQDVPLIVGDGSLLTGATGTQTVTATTTTFSSGPNHYNDPINWTGGRLPDSGDAIYFEEGASDCLFGLNQCATFTANAGTETLTFTSPCDLVNDQIVNVTNAGGGLPGGLAAATPYYLVNVDRNAGTCQLANSSGGAAIDITTAGTGTHTIAIRLASFEHNSKYTGAIGLSKLNGLGYFEYRPLYLHFGLQAAGAKTVTLGTGQGSGSGKIQLDTDVDQAIVKVIQTGGSIESGIPALLWKGTHASNTLNMIDGDMAVALFAGETSALASLVQRGGSIELGAGVTITGPIDKTGGTLLCDGTTINGSCLVR